MDSKILFENQESAEINKCRAEQKKQEKILAEAVAKTKQALYDAFVKNTGVKVGSIIKVDGNLRKIASIGFRYSSGARIEVFKQKKNGDWYQHPNELYSCDFKCFEIVEDKE